jgi:hypothetical protein
MSCDALHSIGGQKYTVLGKTAFSESTKPEQDASFSIMKWKIYW